MADYWKSQPKKFCEYCKCWIADNKPSVEFHERGKNHKENVAKKIDEIKKKSMEKAKQEAEQCKEFAAMEDAAMKAYLEDLKRLGAVTGVQDTRQAAQPERQSGNSFQSKVQKTQEVNPISLQETEDQNTDGMQRTEGSEDYSLSQSTGAGAWVKGVSPEGYVYYYNTVTKVSQWEKPPDFQEGSAAIKGSESQTQKSTSNAWAKGVTEGGLTYYYNTLTGESRWDKPEDFPECTDTDSRSESSQQTAEREEPATSESEKVKGEEDEVEEEEELDKEEKHDKAALEVENPKMHIRSPDSSNSEEEEEEDEESHTETKDAESDDKEEEIAAEEKLPEVQRKVNPYGTWEEIKYEPDPYEQVDLQLPSTEDHYLAPAVSDIPFEPEVKFKEKTITSLGENSGGDAVFRKRKMENGKSRNLRRREDNA